MMKEENNENLQELFEKFPEAADPEQAARDILRADEIIDSFPAVEPGRKLLAEIEMKVESALLQKKVRRFKRFAYKAVAAAAAVIVITAIAARLFKEGKKYQPPATVTANVLWDSDDFVADDADLADLEAEIDQVENELVAVYTGESSINGGDSVEELETELSEINGDFWKG